MKSPLWLCLFIASTQVSAELPVSKIMANMKATGIYAALEGAGKERKLLLPSRNDVIYIYDYPATGLETRTSNYVGARIKDSAVSSVADRGRFVTTIVKKPTPGGNPGEVIAREFDQLPAYRMGHNNSIDLRDPPNKNFQENRYLRTQKLVHVLDEYSPNGAQSYKVWELSQDGRSLFANHYDPNGQKLSESFKLPYEDKGQILDFTPNGNQLDVVIIGDDGKMKRQTFQLKEIVQRERSDIALYGRKPIREVALSDSEMNAYKARIMHQPAEVTAGSLGFEATTTAH